MGTVSNNTSMSEQGQGNENDLHTAMESGNSMSRLSGRSGTVERGAPREPREADSVHETEVQPSGMEAVILKSVTRLVMYAEKEISKHTRLGTQREDAMMDIRREAEALEKLVNMVVGTKHNGTREVDEELQNTLRRAQIITAVDVKNLVALATNSGAIVQEICHVLGCGEEDVVDTVKVKEDVLNSVCTTLDCDQSVVAEKCVNRVMRCEELEKKQLESIERNSVVDVTNGENKKSSVKDEDFDKLIERFNRVKQGRSIDGYVRSNSGSTVGSVLMTGSVVRESRDKVNTWKDSQVREGDNCGGYNVSPQDFHWFGDQRSNHGRTHMGQADQSLGRDLLQTRESDSEKSMMYEFMRSQAAPPIGNFSGDGSQPWSAYVKSFLIRYPKEVWRDDHLRDMLVEKLTGSARDHFKILKREDREGSFDRLVWAMKLRMNEAGRIETVKAMSSVRSLYKSRDESVAKFCVRLELLTGKAYPQLSDEALSMTRADILYQQLRHWQEAVHLVNALEDSEESQAYEEVKRLALRMDRNRSSLPDKRFYRNDTSTDKIVGTPFKASDDVRSTQREGRRCFKCNGLGHIAQNCNAGEVPKPGPPGGYVRSSFVVKEDPKKESFASRIVRELREDRKKEDLKKEDPNTGITFRSQSARVVQYENPVQEYHPRRMAYWNRQRRYC